MIHWQRVKDLVGGLGRSGTTPYLPVSMSPEFQRLLDAAKISCWQFDVAEMASTGPLDPDKLRGRAGGHLVQIAPKDQFKFTEAINDALHGEPSTFELEYRRLKVPSASKPEADEQWCKDVGIVYRDAQGKPSAIVGLTQDITESKAAQARLEEARAEAALGSQAKSEFLAYMSHEIRTPLAAIIGFCEILEDPKLPAEERAESVHIIKRNGELLCQIVNNILDLTKIEAGRFEVEMLRCNPREMVNDICALLGPRAKAKGVTLDCDFEEPIPQEVITDPTRFKQILINVIGNAVKFTEQGRVHVRLHCRPHATAMGHWRLACEVEDTGIGFSDEHRQRLFQAFVQAECGISRRFGGSGLGLAVSRELARKLGGDVELVHTELGVGSKFLVHVLAASSSMGADPLQ